MVSYTSRRERAAKQNEKSPGKDLTNFRFCGIMIELPHKKRGRTINPGTLKIEQCNLEREPLKIPNLTEAPEGAEGRIQVEARL